MRRFALAIALVGVAVLATCSGDERSAATTPVKSAPPPETTPPIVPKRRRGETKPAESEEVKRVPEPASAALDPTKGRVRVHVTKAGVPVPGAHVWLGPAPTRDPTEPIEEWSDEAYHLGPPRWVHLAPGFNPIRAYYPANSACTGADGVVEIDGDPGRALVIVDGPVTSIIATPRVVEFPPAGGSLDVEFAAHMLGNVSGLCRGPDGPVTAFIQAFDVDSDRAISNMDTTREDGSFSLFFGGEPARVRLRAVASRTFPLFDSEDAASKLVEDATLVVAVDGSPVEIRLARSAVVVIELTSDADFRHVQVEGLVFDASAAAWGRLGGPVGGRHDASKHAFLALPAADCARPLVLWTWGPPAMLTAVDPRGKTRVSAHFPRGRKVSVVGNGWLSGDRIRVVCRAGPPGEEIAAIWTEGEVCTGATWGRGDVPPWETEFRLVRDGREIGRVRVPAGGEDANVRLDL